MTSHFNFENSTSPQLLFYAFIIIGLWHIELFFKKEKMGVKWQHSQFNIYFILTALLVQLPLTVFVLKTIQWCGLHHWGIYYELPFSTGIIWKSITGIVLLDFFEYLYHLMMHKFNE